MGVLVTCPRCGGQPGGCERCAFTGQWRPSESIVRTAVRGILAKVEKFPDENVFLSHEVLEALNTTEYNALTATKKDGIKMLLMCGFVDLNEGKAGKTRLWEWFGAESTTVEALQALIDG
jgi:hypothetical protein